MAEERPSPHGTDAEPPSSRDTPQCRPSGSSGRTIDPELAAVLKESGFTGGKSACDLPADVAELFCVPERDAAQYLGKRLTALKKLCRRHNLLRWPSLVYNDPHMGLRVLLPALLQFFPRRR